MDPRNPESEPRPIIKSNHVAHEHSIPGTRGVWNAITGLTFRHSHGGPVIHFHQVSNAPLLPMPEPKG